MTTKEKIVRKSIAEITKKIQALNEVLNARPLSDILAIRSEAQELLNKTKGDDRFKVSFIDKISELADKEKKAFRIAVKGRDSIKLINKKVDLEIELGDLHNELFRIERDKKTNRE